MRTTTFQLWNTSRAILSHEDPYGLEVAERDQLFSYGANAKSLGLANDRQLAYPLPALFPVLPLGLLEFRLADKLALFLMTVLITASIGWLRGIWDGATILYCILAFGSYPIIVALQMRQPTLLFLGFMVSTLALLRSGRQDFSRNRGRSGLRQTTDCCPSAPAHAYLERRSVAPSSQICYRVCRITAGTLTNQRCGVSGVDR